MKRILSLFLCVMMCLGLLCLAVPDSRADSNPVKKNGRSVSSADELRRYDIVTFGTYPLRSYDDDAPIEWIVIKKSGTRVTLVTRDLIDSQTFHHTAAGAVTWQSCDLNRWLNDTFLESAFTSKEQDMITGSVTIPSLAEARSMPADMLNPVFTPYAIERGGNSSLIIWWLRD